MAIAVESAVLLDELLTDDIATELLPGDETLDGVLLREDAPNEEDRLSEETLNEETLNDEKLESALLVVLLILNDTDVRLLDAGLELLLPLLPPPQATSKQQAAAVITGATKCLNETKFLVKKSCDKKE